MSITVNTLIEGLCGHLNCSQRVLAGLLGVEAHSLTYNKEKSIEESSGKTVRRLAILYILVFQELHALRPQLIFELLNNHVFEDLQGRTDSVASALQQDKYGPETLFNILQMAKNNLEETNRLAHPELSEMKRLVSA